MVEGEGKGGLESRSVSVKVKHQPDKPSLAEPGLQGETKREERAFPMWIDETRAKKVTHRSQKHIREIKLNSHHNPKMDVSQQDTCRTH